LRLRRSDASRLSGAAAMADSPSAFGASDVGWLTGVGDPPAGGVAVAGGAAVGALSASGAAQLAMRHRTAQSPGSLTCAPRRLARG
jgi:hypothetical protein